MSHAQPVPEGVPRVTPYLIVDGAAAAIEFYAGVFDAEESLRITEPDGRVGHAELRLGEAVIMLADQFPDMDILGPKTIGGTAVIVHVYVADVDAVFARALAEGATALREVRDEFYGDRTGSFEDPWGHRWSVATHVEDVTEEQLRARAAE
ncbi:VOC family protein [Salininema proteolyticum]|uniref:VOC family protein n=1 Tax=Salininema proteolyticum TaxID=1607685 RepID=A0ABV8U2Y5_9ACTN